MKEKGYRKEKRRPNVSSDKLLVHCDACSPAFAFMTYKGANLIRPRISKGNWNGNCQRYVLVCYDAKWLNLRTLLGQRRRQLANTENSLWECHNKTALRPENRSATTQCWVIPVENAKELIKTNQNSKPTLRQEKLSAKFILLVVPMLESACRGTLTSVYWLRLRTVLTIGNKYLS